MKQTLFPFALAVAVLLTACGDSTTAAEKSNDSSTATSPGPEVTNQSSPAAPTASANDRAIAVIENSQVRFKLHSLQEVTPAADAPAKQAEGKTVYAADISAEYLAPHNKSAAEYMLSSYIVDDKGNKLSLPMGSTRLAMLVSSSQAAQDNAAGEAFNQSNPTKGQVFRGRHYGVEMQSGNKPVKWGMQLDGKEVEVAIQQ